MSGGNIATNRASRAVWFLEQNSRSLQPEKGTGHRHPAGAPGETPHPVRTGLLHNIRESDIDPLAAAELMTMDGNRDLFPGFQGSERFGGDFHRGIFRDKS